MITLLHPQDWTWRLKWWCPKARIPSSTSEPITASRLNNRGIYVCCAIDFATQSSYIILLHQKMHLKGYRIYSRHWTFENQNGCKAMPTSLMHPSDGKCESNWVSKKWKPQPKQGFPDLPTAGWCHLKNCFTTCGKLNQNPCEKNMFTVYIYFIQKAYVNWQYFTHYCPAFVLTNEKNIWYFVFFVLLLVIRKKDLGPDERFIGVKMP